ncbi:MAG: hypothetical protein M3285_14125 [Actinomycetota bacterium]|nr:hypothetical protein [Actinomycetota bacterium]
MLANIRTQAPRTALRFIGGQRSQAWRGSSSQQPVSQQCRNVAGKLVQRSRQDNDGNKRQTVEIQVTHVGPGRGRPRGLSTCLELYLRLFEQSRVA